MELDDAWSIGMVEVFGLEHDVITTGKDGRSGAFQKSVVVGSEHVGPREFKKFYVKWGGLVLWVGNGIPEYAIEGRAAERSLDLVR